MLDRGLWRTGWKQPEGVAATPVGGSVPNQSRLFQNATFDNEFGKSCYNNQACVSPIEH